MIVLKLLLWILLLLIVLVFFVPYGVDAGYEGGAVWLRVAAGPFRFTLYPKKPPSEKQKARAEKKREKEKAKAEKQREKEKEKKKTAEPKEQKTAKEKKPKGKNETIKVRKKIDMDIDHIMMYLKLASHAIRRLFKSFTIDLFRLHYTVGCMDPYTTAMQYGYACTAIETLPALTGEIIHVRKNDIEIAADFTRDTPTAAVRIVLTLQLYKIVHMGVAFLAEYLIWNRKLRAERAAAVTTEREDKNGRQQDQ